MKYGLEIEFIFDIDKDGDVRYQLHTTGFHIKGDGFPDVPGAWNHAAAMLEDKLAEVHGHSEDVEGDDEQ